MKHRSLKTKKKEIQVKLDGVSAPSTSQLGHSLDVFTIAGQRLSLSAALLDSGSKDGRTQSQFACHTHFSKTLKTTVFWRNKRFYAKDGQWRMYLTLCVDIGYWMELLVVQAAQGFKLLVRPLRKLLAVLPGVKWEDRSP